MSPIAVIGQGALTAALLVTTATIVSAVIAALSGARRYAVAAEYGMFTIFALYGVAATAMIHGFIHQDLSLIYVYKYSDATMPWFYQLAAFWGGQAGSLMFWAGVLSIFSGLAVYLHREQDRALMPWFITVLAVVQWFFTMLLVAVTDPFESFGLIPPPPDGAGMNPQLQTFTMIIHPPSLLTGYVACTIPFAFAMAALLSGRLDDQWLKSTRKWSLIAWLFLATGLLLGMLWAYTELGWGGYWAWDPVENAAFIPWMIITALIHSAVIQERRGMLKRWNMFLVLTAWLATILGTYITRSGLIVSVHSFAKSSIGPYFKWFLLAGVGASFAALAYRWDALKATNRIESPLSREAAFLANNWLFLGSAFVVLWGTLFPKIKEMFTGKPDVFGVPILDQTMVWVALAGALFCAIATVTAWSSSRGGKRWWLFLGAVGLTITAAYLGSNKLFEGPAVTIREGWFNSWMAPLGVLALLMVGVGTVIAWRKATAKNFWRSFFWPLISAGGITVVVAGLYYGLRLRTLGAVPSFGGAAYALLSVYACAFVTIVTVGEFWRGTVTRKRKLGVDGLTALTGLVMRNQRRYGGYLVHLGVVLLFLGFLGAAFRVEARVTVSEGQRVALGDYEVEFVQLREERDIEKQMVFAQINLWRDGALAGALEPGRYLYNSHPNSPTTEVDVKVNPVEDVYFALSQVHIWEKGKQQVTLMMVVNPFVFWIWVGGLVMIFGTFIALWPQAEVVKVEGRARSGAGGAGGAGGKRDDDGEDEEESTEALAQHGKLGRRMATGLVLLSLAGGAMLWSWRARADAPSPTAAPAAAAADAVEAGEVERLHPEERLIHTLIQCECKGCSGQSIANCHPGCGEGLRDRARVHEMISQGKGREHILAVFVSERGEGVLMSPPLSGFNQLVWALPLLVMGAGIPVVVVVARKSKRRATPSAAPGAAADASSAPSSDEDAPLSPQQRARLEKLERELESMD
jgi:cytochrome c-type biogenesis protein CcmF